MAIYEYIGFWCDIFIACHLYNIQSNETSSCKAVRDDIIDTSINKPSIFNEVTILHIQDCWFCMQDIFEMHLWAENKWKFTLEENYNYSLQ